MRVFRKRVGDIFFNPVMQDLWILNKVYDADENKEVWTLNLIHEDYQEQLKYVKGFIRVGNIYDMVRDKLNKDEI